jgi:phosphoadenosine phosphosulfate reductase
MSATNAPTLEELNARSLDFEHAAPNDIIAWASEQFGEGLVFTASFEDAVLIDLVARTAPSIEIILLDTQYLFAETEWFAEELRKRYDLRLTRMSPLPEVRPDNLWQTDLAGCCGVRKVEPLQRALAGRAAWITGIRRVDAPTRANAPIVSYDLSRQVVKINPLATWSDEQVALYEELEQLPRHPLTTKGYASIGCWPCTQPVAPGQDRRAGRWTGSGKVECGLHA